uniref:Uncharacterized protein n=1 Tax=Haptolina brevifila TaxID=156173 RepID=A0A7S2MA43_9EUKA
MRVMSDGQYACRLLNPTRSTCICLFRWAQGDADAPSQRSPSGSASSLALPLLMDIAEEFEPAEHATPLPEQGHEHVIDLGEEPTAADSRTRWAGGVCSLFIPKRPGGPLARRCHTCNEHMSLHPQAAAPSKDPAD